MPAQTILPPKERREVLERLKQKRAAEIARKEQLAKSPSNTPPPKESEPARPQTLNYRNPHDIFKLKTCKLSREEGEIRETRPALRREKSRKKDGASESPHQKEAACSKRKRKPELVEGKACRPVDDGDSRPRKRGRR